MKESIGFLGAGNMAQTLIAAWVGQKIVASDMIYASNRTPGKLKKLSETYAIHSCATNEEAVDQSNVVVLAIKPQDLIAAVEPIASTFREDQIVISLAAGLSLRKLRGVLPQCPHLVRVMANTPAKIGQGLFAYCTRGNDMIVDLAMDRLFKPIGLTTKLEEGEAFEAFTVATSAGIGFIYEMMIYWQEWLEERGIDSDLSRLMTIQTFLGASELALKSQPLGLEELQAKVTSKKGVTAAGLESLRELELERLLRYSFEKAALRDRELSQD